MVAGVQVPGIGNVLSENTGKVPGIVFWQYGPSCVNAGNVGDLVSIDTVVTDAHWPVAGVKVYVWIPVKDVLIMAGDQVPDIGRVFIESDGKLTVISFWQ